MFGRTITLEKIGATTAEAYRIMMKSCFHLATPADASWLNVRMWHGASPGGFAGKCLTCKLSFSGQVIFAGFKESSKNAVAAHQVRAPI